MKVEMVQNGNLNLTTQRMYKITCPINRVLLFKYRPLTGWFDLGAQGFSSVEIAFPAELNSTTPKACGSLAQ